MTRHSSSPVRPTLDLATIAFLALSVGACGDEHDHDHDHEDAFAEACEHFGDAPTALTASADAASATAALQNDHTRYDVTLTGGEGFVLFPSAEATEVRFFLGSDVPFELLRDGAVVAPEEVETITTGCAAVRMVYTYDVEVASYVAHFGPEAGERVSLVWEEGSHEHEHEHD